MDRTFIENEVTPRLIEIQAEPGTTIKRVRDFNERGIGKLLDNRTGEATLIVVDLPHDFLDQRNKLTAAIFWMRDPSFAGMDWKVPIFLFTILVALGQDHNVFLISRIKEEQLESGMIGGIRTALASTGSPLSKCGLLTAAALFCLAVSGYLGGSRQLGTALTIGILLDIFVARRIHFPAWLLTLEPNRSRILTSNPFSGQT